MTSQAATGFFRTLILLLKASRRRSEGRGKRQQQLLNNRSGRGAFDWGALAIIISIGFTAFLHGASAFAIISAVEAGQHVRAEREGSVVVSKAFLEQMREADQPQMEGPIPTPAQREATRDYFIRDEAKEIVERSGGEKAVIEERLRAAVKAGGHALMSRDAAEPGIDMLSRSDRAGILLGSCALLWWLAMLACQGEGLELDLQRRRHPMWEWLLSHPVGAGAVFLAEMLSPLSANPTYWTAPLFAGMLYGQIWGFGGGVAAAVLIGIPLSVAAGCLGKALEIGAVLRLPPRSRGAVVGILSWFGYASMVAMFFGSRIMPVITTKLGQLIDQDGGSALSALGLFLGMGSDGRFSFLHGLLFCWGLSAVLLAASVIFCARSIRKGLSGAFASDMPVRRRGKEASFGRDPLFRKEYLWFVRDRSAIVQTILVPLTIAGFQMVNLRSFVAHAQDSWNYLSGAAILFGTYFLLVLGPKSLTSEGSALWIALTWPRGLESVLKAKAWLWSTISSAIVAAILLAACWLFPHDIWKVALVAAGWYFFARSMAEKSVTLVTIVSESGEAQKIPAGRRWAAQLGMLTFAIGIFTQQWNLAIVGIVYSWITAAAMWENLRARLPYLYDPWSERLPPPPTLMHAMIAISILIECSAVVTGSVLAFGGKDSLAIAQAFGYAICAVGVSIAMSSFLAERDVSPARIWCWREDEPDPALKEPWLRRYLAGNIPDLRWLLYGIGGGVLLGLLAQAYLMAVAFIPSVGEMIHRSQQQMHSIPNMLTAYGVMAILFAPFAEEYLFRGLVYRTLDRQWGGWKAVLGAAAFFAIYHPPVAWVPVALLGAINCVLFKKSGRLAPGILLHMAYNSVVVLWL